MSLSFVLFSVISGLIAGIGSTTILRFYLRKKISFDSFGFKQFSTIVIATVVTAVLYGALSYFMGYAYAKLGPEISELEKDLFKAYNSYWLLAFTSLFVIFAWLICYLVIKLLLKINKDRIERLELNTNLKQAQLNTLKGQINPHFMFNSLNNIRGLMLEDVDKSREMLTKLSEMLRYSLTKNNINSIAVEEELEMVDNYIDLSKIQFEDRLQFEKSVDKECLQVQIPPMIIQLLVENAAKHGISNLKDGGKISLNIDKHAKVLSIKVVNTGKLRITKGSTQVGLKNIKQRLKLLYGDKATFKLKEANDEVLAEIKIPMS
ncbi:histidine kinase [uncultured Croceitalea sp.]|uniref:sensor histidine kinase n=1 Tax=uncultured Croceitalea sp. TaxID=1798908 RepID=UPI0033066F77